MDEKSTADQSRGGARRAAAQLCAPVLLLVALLMILYPFLHASATIRAWGTPALPNDWPMNLGIALLIGIAGILLLGAAWKMAQRAFGFNMGGNHAHTAE